MYVFLQKILIFIAVPYEMSTSVHSSIQEICQAFGPYSINNYSYLTNLKPLFIKCKPSRTPCLMQMWYSLDIINVHFFGLNFFDKNFFIAFAFPFGGTCAGLFRTWRRKTHFIKIFRLEKALQTSLKRSHLTWPHRPLFQSADRLHFVRNTRTNRLCTQPF